MHDSRRTRLVLGVLMVTALVLIAADYRGGGSPVVSGIRKVSGTVFGGTERAVSSATGLFGGSGSGSSAQVKTLSQEVVRLRAELSREQLSKTDYAQLRRLLSLAGRGGYRIVAANVIATGTGYQRSVTLDAGSRDGVAPLETVLNGDGLVGEVTSVTADTSTVLLATDSSAQIGVELAPSGQVGWVTGPGQTPSGTGLLQLQVLDATALLTPGEQVVTSASVKDRPYVPGVPVGVISAVENRAGALTARATVAPYVNFTALGVVGIVIAPPHRNPRFSALPPRPQAKPTPTVTVTVTPRARTPVPGGAPSGSTGPTAPTAGG
ncbi:MAG TPA: rod shape-determining protein MreC [Streptosporangiaceae bacterium]|nr:rod shape-determining protein MreC [Streptosporangiaceae bacterium]